MSGVALNRATIILGFIGIFIAGYISLSHILHISLPCGIERGCDIVQTHPTSFVFGNATNGGLPVAYVGVLGYVVLTILAIVRSVQRRPLARPLVLAGFVASALGAIYSGYLTYVSLYVIKATCAWCLASAATMVLTTIVYAAMVQADPPKEDAAPPKRDDAALIGAMVAVTALALGFGAYQLKASGASVFMGSASVANEKKIDLVPAGSHIFGPSDAPVTIIEFADLLCPSCQATFPKLEDIVKGGNGKIRLVFHHFPLFMKEDHKMALPGAAVAEMAGEQGKFFDFVAAIYSKSQSDLQTSDALMAVAQSIGLDPSKVSERLQNEGDSAIKKVTDDLNLANQIKIQSTPSIFLQVKGGQVEAIAPSEIEARLKEEPYRSAIAGGNAG